MFFVYLKQSFTYFFLIILIIFVFLLLISINLPIAVAQTSADAIAVRIITNPDNYSALRWYQEQNFTGSPQSLLVDDYEAVRDGRTVYVNAVNIRGNELYTNIYIISYNQEAESATIDIFGRILSHWKFNTNIITVGYCSETTDMACLSNIECPAGEYCTSEKAKIIRDTRRLADLAELKILLDQYYNSYGYYPKLESGTYLAHKTMSVWPSWQEALAKELGASLPVDSINKLGDCGDNRFDPITCWDEQSNEFPTDLDIPVFPSLSKVYYYFTDSQGNSGNYCAQMETNYVNVSPSNCFIDVVVNNPPSISNINLPTAYSGFLYEGYIEATDPDSDPLAWSIDTSLGAPWPSWSSAPSLVSTALPNEKTIRADLAGRAGNYDFSITIDDGGAGGQIIRQYTITTLNSNLPTIAQESDKSIIIAQTLNFTIRASEIDNQYPLSFSTSGLPGGLSGVVVNQSDYQISGTVIDQTQDYSVSVTAQDYYQGFSSPITFTITVQNNPPTITSTPNTQGESCVDYSYDVDATDADGHTVSYLASSLPANLSINQTTGLVSGQPQTPGTYSITVTARDQYYSNTISPYSAEDQQSYTLDVAGFSVNPINNATIYTCPSPPGYADTICPDNVYYPGVTYINTASITTSNPVTYSLQNNPAWFLIDGGSGTMNGTALDHDNDSGVYTITVTAANSCGFSASTIFTLTVLVNEWCGDNITQVIHGEECDDGNNNSLDTCDTEGANPSSSGVCTFTFCGDQAVQSPNNFGLNEQCDDGADSDDTNQCDDNCALTYCGDTVVQGPVPYGAGNGPNGQGTGGPANDGNEECDDGADSNDTNQCDDSCVLTYCGDTVVQGPLPYGPGNGPNGQGTGGPADDGNEECDSGIGSYDCTDLGFDGGTLDCSSCFFDTSGCCYKQDGGWTNWSWGACSTPPEPCSGVGNIRSIDAAGEIICSGGSIDPTTAINMTLAGAGAHCNSGIFDWRCGTVQYNWPWLCGSCCNCICDIDFAYNGIQTGTRTCTNPSPFCGGAYCTGSDTTTQPCPSPSYSTLTRCWCADNVFGDPADYCAWDCVPGTCVTLGYECGVHPDGCGGFTGICGICSGPEICQGGTCVNLGP